MTDPTCPVCLESIDRQIVTAFRAFRCSHCHELLREVRLGTGTVTGMVITAVVLVMSLSGQIEWWGELLIHAGALALIALVHTVMVSLLGYTLEPVGRVGLGESEDGD